jgi:hypothetical protein
MKDLTILFYTANLIPETFASFVRNHLLQIVGDTPIVSVSFKPMDFGHNVCVGELEPSTYNIYKQVLIGAFLVKTPYVACCEDDSLYVPEHFQYRPPMDAIAYNLNKWHLNKDCFFHRERANMSMCIAPTQLLVESLCQRYAKYPRFLTPEELHGWGEPGRKDAQIGLPQPKLDKFSTELATLTVNHRGLGGTRIITSKHVVKKELPYWGSSEKLWEQIYGR